MLPLTGPDFLRIELDEIRRRNEGMRHAVRIREARDLRGLRRWRADARRVIGRTP
jgi:hypothetical protein